MADNVIVRNGNEVPFAARERVVDAAEADIRPGAAVTVNADGELVLGASAGEGTFANLNEFEPDDGRDDKYDAEGTARFFNAPIGLEFDAWLEAGADLTTGANATITEGDVLGEGPTGGLADAADADVGGEARYRALEAADNSAAAAGVDNQVRIKVVRIA